MTPTPFMQADTTSWPEAAIAVAGIALVGTIVVIVVWQALATWRARITVSREAAYRGLAERTALELQELNERLAERETIARLAGRETGREGSER
jgi:hypothetical protein